MSYNIRPCSGLELSLREKADAGAVESEFIKTQEQLNEQKSLLQTVEVDFRQFEKDTDRAQTVTDTTV